METKNQLKQIVIKLISDTQRKLESFKSKINGPADNEKSRRSAPHTAGEIKSYYNDSKEERKLH